MGSELLECLKEHVNNVVNNMYLSHLELGIVMTEENKKTNQELSIRLVETGTILTSTFLKVSDHLRDYVTSIKLTDQYSTTSTGGKDSHSHYFPDSKDQIIEININNSLKKNDFVLLSRIQNGEYYVVISRLIG